MQIQTQALCDTLIRALETVRPEKLLPMLLETAKIINISSTPFVIKRLSQDPVTLTLIGFLLKKLDVEIKKIKGYDQMHQQERTKAATTAIKQFIRTRPHPDFVQYVLDNI